jgi:zinc protease
VKLALILIACVACASQPPPKPGPEEFIAGRALDAGPVPADASLDGGVMERSAVLVITRDAGPSDTPDEPFRALPPEPAKAEQFHAPIPQNLTLPNGLHVYLIERHEVPLVALTLAVRSGADTDPSGKAGLASFTLDMLDEGTPTRDAAAIAKGFEDLAVRYVTAADADASSATIISLPDALPKALEIFADVVLHPEFTEPDIKRVKQERLGQIAQALDDPATVGQHVLSRLIYGARHPWGYPAEGTVKSVQGFTRSDLVAWHAGAFRPSSAAIFVVGDVTPAALMPLLTQKFGGWKDSAAPKPVQRVLPKQGERVITVVDKPDAPQSQIWIGEVGVASGAPDIFPVRVMNHILGGGFTSRLNGNLRTEHAFSYGVFSFYDTHREAGPFVAAGGVVADKTADALGEFLKELTKMQSGQVTDAELADAKEALVQSIPAHFTRNEQTAAAYAAAWSHGLPLDYYANYQKRVAAVTKADVAKAAQDRLHPEQMAIVVVGPRAQIAHNLGKLGVGRVELRDANGEAAKAAKASAQPAKK